MILFHFTSKDHLPHILREGLSKGDIPTKNWGSYKGVWFTTDAEPDGHGLTSGEIKHLTKEQRQAIAASTGKKAEAIPEMLKTADKRAVRIEVVIPSTDRRLFHWMKWAKKNVGAEIMERLHKGRRREDEGRNLVHIQWGDRTENFRAIWMRDQSGNYVRASMEELASSVRTPESSS